MESEKLLALALNFKKGFGPRRIFALRERFGTLEEGVREEGIDLSFELERALKELERAERLGVEVAAFFEEAYPSDLLTAPSPPPVIYLKGFLSGLKRVSIVGSRVCSDYGRRTAYRLAKFLARAGVCVVSGLALGIDAAAHRGALDGGGPTVAVLGTGIGRVYPAANRELADRIGRRGALLSEFPLASPARRENFPKRNRIVAALGQALVVVEAKERSGTFITVDYALEMGKEVFAVPGNIDSPFSRGTNKLLREGARPLVDFEELLDFLGGQAPDVKAELPENHLEVYRLLKGAPLTIDQIADKLGLGVGAVGSLLSRLEIEGLVKREGVFWFAL